MTTVKAYCECRLPANEYYGLHTLTKRNTIQYVHSCGRPTEAVWRSWIRKCQVCWGLFSSPWSVLCKVCHTEEHPTGGPFQGWAWARMHDDEYRKKLLDAGARLRYAQEVEGQTPHAPGTDPV